MQAEDINVVESEAGVIASLIKNPELSIMDEGLKPEHFMNRENRTMFRILKELARNEVNDIDAYMIMQNLGPNDNLSLDQVQDFINQADQIARSDTSAYMLLSKKIQEVALKRKLYTKLKECESLCFDSNASDVEMHIYESLDDVIREFEIGADLPEYKDVVDNLWKEIKLRQEFGEREVIKFPFKTLNDFVVMDPGECICFAAPQKAGKSAMLLTCAVDLLKKGKSVLYIDSELSSRLFTNRILAHLSDVKFGKIRSGRYTEEEADRIRNSLQELKQFRFIHKYVPILDENSMLLMAKKAKHMIDIDVIIVDYLKADSRDDQAYSVYASLGRIADTLKNKIAGDMGICALTAAQMTVNGKIADSAKIARNVSTVITITDKSVEEIDREGQEYGTKKMRVLFNRNGDQMRDDQYIDMKFDGSLCKYEESPIQHEEIHPY